MSYWLEENRLWTRQPQCPVPIEYQWIAPSSAGAVVSPGGWNLVDPMLGVTYSTTNMVTTAGAGGRAFASTTGAERIQLASDADNIFDTTNATILVVQSLRSLSYGASLSFGYDGGASDRVLAHLPFSDGTIYFDFGNATNGSGRTSIGGQAFAVGVVDAFAFVSGSRGREIWRNGLRLQRDAGATATRSATSQIAYLGNNGGGCLVNYYFFAVLKEQWSEAKLTKWGKAPWQLFAPLPRRVFFGAAGAAGAYTLTAESGTFTLSGQDATLVKNSVITAEFGAFSIAGQDASFTYTPAGAAYTLTAEYGTFTLSGQDATLVKNSVITAEFGSFVIAGQDASFNYTPAGTTYSLTAEFGTFNLTGQAATLLKSSVLTGAFGSYALTGQAATFTYSGTPPAVTDEPDFIMSFPGGVDQRIGASSPGDSGSRIGPSTASGTTQRILH